MGVGGRQEGATCGRDVGKKRRSRLRSALRKRHRAGRHSTDGRGEVGSGGCESSHPPRCQPNSNGRPGHSKSGERGQIPPLKMDADAES